ncbi:phosphodiesterase [Janibacter sp. Soil728]|jgi:hypothetical protein|uniref:DUF5998 family protein n=1 Tax=Janibacter sp. Soil728 TaxID=1736393 RepID=UPI0006FD954E|nr:DUF5998 family protein [Janibacter sp. Soil728]KRE36866.1 phosphodiesterase [Janibacter sp. Soil728]MDN5715987.1 DUF5998 family protein [Janibacter sp.]
MPAPADLTAITLPPALTADIERAGYYPALVADVIKAAVGAEDVHGHLVHQETTFDQDTVRRHITVFARTTTRLVVAHADDYPDHFSGAQEIATATTECIPLSNVRGVMLTHVVGDPSSYVPGSLGRELTLTVGWGAVSRVDLLPAQCNDPECDGGDHGYEGTVTSDDIALRISAEAEGRTALDRAIEFARDLSASIGH